MIACFSILLAINACTNFSHSKSEAMINYDCDEGSFWVTYSQDGLVANLTIDIETIKMDLVTNDPVKEYSDKTTTFWPEGRNNVFVREDLAALYHNCTKV